MFTKIVTLALLICIYQLDSSGVQSATGLFVCNHSEISPEYSEEWAVPGFMSANGELIKFSLKIMADGLACGVGHRVVQIQLNSAPKSSEIVLHQNGYLQNGSETEHDYRSPGQYCIEKLSSSAVHLKICNGICSEQNGCVRKCCPMSKLFSPKEPLCQRYNDSNRWRPRLYTNVYDSNTQYRLTPSAQAPLHPFFYLRLWANEEWERNCKSGHMQIIFNRISKRTGQARERFRVGINGDILVWSMDKREWESEPGPHCTDELIDGSGSMLIFCTQFYEQQGAPTFYGVLVLGTSFFALATVVIHFLLWEKQNIHSWTIMSFAGALFMFFFILGISQLSSYNQEFLRTTGCKIIGTLGHFFIIAMFTWLMVISLDLYLTFRDIMVARSRGIKRYLMYSAIGWGIPLFMVIVAWSLELGYGSDNYSTVKVPHYGRRNCYITQYAMTEYAYGPCTALYLVNIVLFVLTMQKLVEVKHSTRFARTDTKKDRQSFYLFFKLFFVIGVLWIIEFCGWYLEHGHATWYWMILDLTNCLQPVSLFVIFILKVDVLKSLSEKYPSVSPVTSPLISILKSMEQKCGPDGKKNESGDHELQSSSKSGKSTLSTETTNCDDITGL